MNEQQKTIRSMTVRERARPSIWLLAVVLISFLAVSCGDDDPTEPDPPTVEDQCADLGEYLHAAGFCDTPGTADGVAVAGDYAYVANDISGLHVVMSLCQP